MKRPGNPSGRDDDNPILDIQQLDKVYAGGFRALNQVNLQIRKGEIFALLGPNGAGKTTLISTVCGIANPSGGSVTVGGFDIIRDYRKTRSLIGLVPQELTTDAFESVWDTVSLSRGLFGKPPNPGLIEKILRQLSLWEKRSGKLVTLSGGMKRRVMIAKALSHEPDILFLDEPTAGVDVNLRQDMWRLVRELQQGGVTIILTTHYIEEAEEMADRIGVINHGEIVVVEHTRELMRKLGRKELLIDLREPLSFVPQSLENWSLNLHHEGHQLVYTYDSTKEDNGISELMAALAAESIGYRDIHTDQSSLEEIFMELVKPK